MCRKLVCKNNIVDSIKDYGSLELKLFYNMLYIFKENVRFKQFEQCEEMEIDFNTLSKYIPDRNITQKRIRNLIKDMPKEIYFTDDDNMGYVAVFEYMKYNFEFKSLEYKITETFGNILLEVLDKYTIIELQYITKLKSKYSQRLYELSRRYVKQTHYLMPIDDFREYFNIPINYKMCNINQRVLEPALKELNELTNINCEIVKKKKGRNVTHILFKFNEKE